VNVLDLGCPRLSEDPTAIQVVKDETVTVEFASTPGMLMSAVGPNHYAIGDAIITGSTGDRWTVTRDRFDAKYRPADGQSAGLSGRYRNVPVPIWAKRILEPFTIERQSGGDRLRGVAGDWAVEYALNDCGLVAHERFTAVYRPVG
jgi:PGDYG protein